MIITGALVFVWFLNNKQSKPSKDLAINMAITQLENKEFKKAEFKASAVEFTDINDNKFVTTIGSDATREILMKKIDGFQHGQPDECR